MFINIHCISLHFYIYLCVYFISCISLFYISYTQACQKLLTQFKTLKEALVGAGAQPFDVQAFVARYRMQCPSAVYANHIIPYFIEKIIFCCVSIVLHYKVVKCLFYWLWNVLCRVLINFLCLYYYVSSSTVNVCWMWVSQLRWSTVPRKVDRKVKWMQRLHKWYVHVYIFMS